MEILFNLSTLLYRFRLDKLLNNLLDNAPIQIKDTENIWVTV